MNKATIALACMLYAVTNSVLFAEQDDSYDHDASSYDRDTSYDYGTGSYDRDAERDSGWSGTSGRDGTGRMYSDRDREGSDWYGQRSQRGSYRDDGRTWGDDMSRDRSAWRQGRYDQGYGRQSEFDQDGGYDQSRYGYMGSDGYDDWRLRDRDSGRRGYDQRSGQDWDQDRRFSDRDWRGDSYAQGRQQRGMGGGQSVAILGQLTNENASISGVNPNNKVIELRTQSGSTICVDLGPSDQTQKLNLSQNQSLFARGQLTNISGQRVLRAQEIAKVSERITLNRSQGGSGQIYGFQNGTMGSQGAVRPDRPDRQVPIAERTKRFR
jgi:hypothetical protein